MSLFSNCIISILAVFAIGIFQGETLHSQSVNARDSIYDQFCSMIDFEVALVKSKLNLIASLVELKLSSAPQDPTIQANMSQCFEAACNQYPEADPTCIEDVWEAVNQTIYDTAQQLGYCANLTHGWLVAKGQLPQAYSANASMDAVVAKILKGAQQCAKHFGRYPTKEYNCMQKVQQQYSSEWNSACENITQAYDMLSGVYLLVGLNVNDCITLVEGTLNPKCDEITADVVSCTQNSTKHDF